jgi:hypothetical protein
VCGREVGVGLKEGIELKEGSPDDATEGEGQSLVVVTKRSQFIGKSWRGGYGGDPCNVMTVLFHF